MFADFQDLKIFDKKKKLLNTNFTILIINKPSLVLREVPQKFGPDQFSRFDVYWIQNPNRQAKFSYYRFMKNTNISLFSFQINP